MIDSALHKILAMVAVVALGWLLARRRWLGEAANEALSRLALYVFIPALLFRTMAAMDLGQLPWGILAAYFVPATVFMALVYLQQRHTGTPAGSRALGAATRALGATFGNTVQLGIPVALALFGSRGLGLHLTLVSVHALILLVGMTVVAEVDLAHERRQPGEGTGVAKAVLQAVRNALWHPVVLPVLAGMAWHVAGWPLPEPAAEALGMLSSAVVPACLLVIGMSLAHHGVAGYWRAALGVSALKLVVLPACVWAVAQGVFGLGGAPLQVLVMAAALPVGTNPLIFAQRYRTLEGEMAAAIVFSTLAYAFSASAWMAALLAFAPA